jgi:hypothetical protein
MVSSMNGIQIESMLTLIDRNIQSSMDCVRDEVLRYLQDHGDELAREISRSGSAIIPTRLGDVKVTREDLAAIA